MANDFDRINSMFEAYFGGGFNKLITVNTDEYDLVPKKSFIEKQIKDLEERVANYKNQKNAEVAIWNDRILKTEEEIANLKKKL